LKEKTGLAYTPRTIRRELIRQDIQHYTALRKPKLTDQLAAKQLTFAKLYIKKPLAYWQRMVFSDESTVARSKKKKQKWVFYRKIRRTPNHIAQH